LPGARDEVQMTKVAAATRNPNDERWTGQGG
jgi:hypothetical protein